MRSAKLQQESSGFVFVAEDAQATIDILAQEVSQVKQKANLSIQVLETLHSYEGQIDTENFCRKYFPNITHHSQKIDRTTPFGLTTPS